MFFRTISLVVVYTYLSALVLLLGGCYVEESYDTVESNQLATKNIGFSVDLIQDELGDSINVVVEPFSTSDGFEKNARVRFSASDVLSMSVQGQDVEPLKIAGNESTNFAFTQSSLNLPATFVIKLTRDETREDALETYVTLDAVFETIAPIHGDIFARDSIVEFAWTLRDGDGNAVVGTEAVGSVSTFEQAGEAFARVAFEQTSVTQDGASRKGRLPALQLVPPELLERDNERWDVFVQLTGADEPLSLPVTFEFDPALANNRSLDGLFGATTFVFAKDVGITIR